MGKTCLRERILYEVKRDQPSRVCLSFNFEGKAELAQDKMYGIKLEFWFFKEMASAFDKQGYPFPYEWTVAFEENKDKRDKARDRLRQHLASIKVKTGYTVLFTFDETEHLVKADTQIAKHRYALFSLFRSLLQEGLLCLIATSYPFGADNRYALNIANNDATSPIYNTFPHKLTLTPWLPSQAWDFLHSRLAGFGVILPRRYRREVLEISRGVPWISHFWGQTLCVTLLKLASANKIVDNQAWHLSKLTVLQEIHKELQQSVERTAEVQDQLYRINGEAHSERLLGQGHLWGALVNLAKRQAFTCLQDEKVWPSCLGFDMVELEQMLPDTNKIALHETLIRLAATPLLEGNANNGKRYQFANNLLPMWLTYSTGEF